MEITTVTKPYVTEKGYIQTDVSVTLGKNPIDVTGVTLGFELGMDYCSLDNTFCQVRTNSHIMTFDVTPEQLEKMASLMREEIKRINDGKYAKDHYGALLRGVD